MNENEDENEDEDENKKTKDMRKIYLFAIAALMLGACGQNGVSEEQVQHERDSLQRIIDEKDVELNDLMGTFGEVQDGIRRINEAEGRITVADGNPESASSREVIRENMAFIQEAMQQNRALIAQLQEKLKASTFNAKKLNQTIENLQAQIESQAQRIQELEATLAEKEALIAEQGEEISNLGERVNTLSADNASKQQTLAQQDKDLNAAWFVFGTKSELKAEKILSDGDVLRNGDFNKDYFTQIDIRYDKEIRFYSKNVKVLTTHPNDSYKLVKDKQGQYSLNVTNPQKFWSVSKYLVVQVK